MTYLLSILGFLAAISIIIGPFIAIVFFIAWLLAGKERKRLFGKIALIGVGMVAGGIAVTFLTFVLFTLGGSGGEDIDISPPEITDEQPDDAEEEIPFINEID